MKEKKEKIIIFGKEYIKSDLPKEINLECGCKYKKLDANIGISYTQIKKCEIHDFKEENLSKMKKDNKKRIGKKIESKIYKKYSIEHQINLLRKVILNLDNTKLKKELKEMDDFIDPNVQKYRKLSDKIDKSLTLEELEKIKEED